VVLVWTGGTVVQSHVDLCWCVCECSSHMQDLKDVTRDVHYENYRSRHIQQQLAHSHKQRKSVITMHTFYILSVIVAHKLYWAHSMRP